jgi:hypothetical protein
MNNTNGGNKMKNNDLSKYDYLMDSHKMITNILLLKEIYNKPMEYKGALDDETCIAIQNLKRSFESGFNVLCMDFQNAFEDIISEKIYKDDDI